MPFIPHTEQDVAAMLDVIGEPSIDALFDEIDPALHIEELDLPPASNEMAMLADMTERAAMNETMQCFIGAGCYDHHIPAAVWDIAGRGEFMTAYTPYQAEASQGTLQVIYEFQTMMTELTGLDVSNASVYDGATALAEATLMAVRGNRKNSSRKVLLAGTVHPHYVETTRNIARMQGIEVVTREVADDGRADPTQLAGDDEPPVAVIIPQPNFLGLFEPVDAITDWAHGVGALVIAVVNPTALAITKPPGEWGARGADIACGDGQPLGIPMASGGPSFGFICARQALVRQLPGRIAGRTVDQQGREGFTLTLQAREQHIRRGKATSNICTNQGLLVTAATIYLSLLGGEGLRQVAISCHANTRLLVDRLCEIPGVRRAFDGAYFHECAIDLGRPAENVVEEMIDREILPGLALGRYFPHLGNVLLVCATERRTEAQIEHYAENLARVLR